MPLPGPLLLGRGNPACRPHCPVGNLQMEEGILATEPPCARSSSPRGVTDHVSRPPDMCTQRGALLPSLELVPTLCEEPRGAVRVDPALQGRDLAYLIASSVPRLNPLACLLVSILIRSPTLKARQRNQQKNSNSPASETVDARILAPPRSSALVTRIKTFFLNEVRPPEPPFSQCWVCPNFF